MITMNSDSSSALAGLFILGIVFFLWFLPILSIMLSSSVSKSEKLAWILAVLFVSWFAWIFYLLLAPISKKNRN